MKSGDKGSKASTQAYLKIVNNNTESNFMFTTAKQFCAQFSRY